MGQYSYISISVKHREPAITVNEAIYRWLGWKEGDRRGAEKRAPLPRGRWEDDYGSESNSASPLETANVPEWMQETDQWISAHQPPALLTLEEPYSDVLSDRLYEAKRAVHWNVGGTPEVVREKAEALNRCEAESARASEFKTAIVDELDRGAESELTIDHQVSVSSGELRIYQSSLNRWAQEAYESSVFQSSKDSPSADRIGGQSENAAEGDDGYDATDDKRDTKDGLRRTAVNSLFVTFASLIESFVEKSGNLFREADDPNVDAIATELSNRAIKPGKRKPTRGQSAERIKDRIEEALEVKSALWKKKP